MYNNSVTAPCTKVLIAPVQTLSEAKVSQVNTGYIKQIYIAKFQKLLKLDITVQVKQAEFVC